MSRALSKNVQIAIWNLITLRNTPLDIDQIMKSHLQMETAFANKCPDATAIMARKTTELILQGITGKKQEVRLKEIADAAYKNHIVTDGVRNMIQRIKEFGDQGAHKDEGVSMWEACEVWSLARQLVHQTCISPTFVPNPDMDIQTMEKISTWRKKIRKLGPQIRRVEQEIWKQKLRKNPNLRKTFAQKTKEKINIHKISVEQDSRRTELNVLRVAAHHHPLPKGQKHPNHRTKDEKRIAIHLGIEHIMKEAHKQTGPSDIYASVTAMQKTVKNYTKNHVPKLILEDSRKEQELLEGVVMERGKGVKKPHETWQAPTHTPEKGKEQQKRFMELTFASRAHYQASCLNTPLAYRTKTWARGKWLETKLKIALAMEKAEKYLGKLRPYTQKEP